jgi:heat shock protein HslJ
MQKTFWLMTAFSAALLISCSYENVTSGHGNSSPQLLSGAQWVAVSIRGLDTIAGSVTLELNGATDLKSSGRAACNEYFSDVLIGATGRIEFGQIAQTMKNCSSDLNETEGIYLTALQKTRRFLIVTDQLKFFDETGVTLVMFKRLTP